MNNYSKPQSLGLADEDQIDLRFYLNFLRTVWFKYFKLILAVNLIGVLAVYLYVQSLGPAYTATATLHVAPKDNTIFNLDQFYWGGTDTTFKETQIGILSSHKLMAQVVEQLDLHKQPYLAANSVRSGILGAVLNPILGTPQVPDDVETAIEQRAFELTQLVSIRDPDQISYSNLLLVSVTMADPDLAAATANALVEAYIAAVFKNDMESTLKTQEFLTNRLTVLRSQLQESERRLRDFMEAEDIVSTDSAGDDVNSELASVSNRYLDAREKRARLENLVQQVRAIQRGGTSVQSVPVIAENAGVSRLSSQVVDLERRKREFSERYGSRHNKMIAVESELASAREALGEQIASALRGLEAELKVARSNEQAAEAQLSEVRGRKQNLGRKDFALSDLQQDVEVKREVYTMFLEKLNQDDAAGPSRNTNLWIADPAVVPRVGSKPSMMIALLAAIAVCTAMSAGVGVLLVAVDNTLETEEDVIEKTGSPLLGLLPIVTGHDEAHNIPFNEYVENLHSRFSEAIRSVRTTLKLLSVQGHEIKKILVTSCHMAEGKTSVSLSLSAAFGQTGTVLLIDADLRRPSVAPVFDGDDGKIYLGLSDVLSGEAHLRDCIYSHYLGGIDVLPAGTRSLNPLELLSSTQFTNLLNDLIKEYDHIVIDSPPCKAVSDAYLLGSMVDTVVLVVKSGTTPVTHVRSVLDRFRENGARIAGVLLNQVDFESPHHPYYKGYYHYDGYGAEDKPVKLNQSAQG